MKNFKVLFGILVAFALFTFTSCEPDQLTDQDQTAISELQIQEAAENNQLEPIAYREYFLPIGMDKKSEEEIAAYKANMSNELLDQLVEQTRIVDYLSSLGLVKQVTERMADGEILTVSNVKHFLSKQQQSDLAIYNGTASTTDRGCGPWEFHGCGHALDNCCLPLCYVTFVCEDKRSCDWWEWSSRYRTTSESSSHRCH